MRFTESKILSVNKFILDTYADFLILNEGPAAATRFSEASHNLISHDQFTRFLNKKDYTPVDLWKITKPLIKSSNANNKCTLVLDDSIEEKPYTKENDVICWHYSHGKGRCVKGIEILSALLVYEDAVIPFSYEVIHKTIEYCDIETKKHKRMSSFNKNELARGLIQKAVDCGINFDTILADNWFCCSETLAFIENLNKKFIFGIKSNRNLYDNFNDREMNIKTKLSEVDLKEGDIIQVFLNVLKFQVRIVKKVFTNENGTRGTLYLVTNDASLNAHDFYSTYQKRWKIEVYHKSLKHNVSLSKSPTKVKRSQLNHIFGAMYAFVQLESIKLKNKKNHFQMKREIHIYSLKMASEKLRELRNEAA